MTPGARRPTWTGCRAPRRPVHLERHAISGIMQVIFDHPTPHNDLSWTVTASRTTRVLDVPNGRSCAPVTNQHRLRSVIRASARMAPDLPSLCHRQPGRRRRRPRAECLFWSARPRRVIDFTLPCAPTPAPIRCATRRQAQSRKSQLMAMSNSVLP